MLYQTKRSQQDRKQNFAVRQWMMLYEQNLADGVPIDDASREVYAKWQQHFRQWDQTVRSRRSDRYCAVAHVREMHSEYCGAGFRHLDQTNPSKANACDVLRKWIISPEHQRQHPFVILSGNVGCGKTHLIYAAMRKLIYRRRRDYFLFNDGDLRREWRRLSCADGGEGESVDELLNELTSDKLLIIDDLGKSKPTNAWADFLYMVFNARYDDRLPTIISTNYDRQAMLNAVGAATTDRIYRARNVSLVIDGDSWRSRPDAFVAPDPPELPAMYAMVRDTSGGWKRVHRMTGKVA